jgi:hypothetical protein
MERAKMDVEHYRYYLRGLLWLFVIHTTTVAIGLFVLPTEYLTYFGLDGYEGRFFQTQAGVFHLVMGVAYLLALFYGQEQKALIYFAIIAKSMAVVFLLIYFSLFEQSWIIIFSAFGDGFLGGMLYFLSIRSEIRISS